MVVEITALWRGSATELISYYNPTVKAFVWVSHACKNSDLNHVFNSVVLGGSGTGMLTLYQRRIALAKLCALYQKYFHNVWDHVTSPMGIPLHPLLNIHPCKRPSIAPGSLCSPLHFTCIHICSQATNLDWTESTTPAKCASPCSSHQMQHPSHTQLTIRNCKPGYNEPIGCLAGSNPLHCLLDRYHRITSPWHAF